jgi:hypothetical protein
MVLNVFLHYASNAWKKIQKKVRKTLTILSVFKTLECPICKTKPIDLARNSKYIKRTLDLTLYIGMTEEEVNVQSNEDHFTQEEIEKINKNNVSKLKLIQ